MLYSLLNKSSVVLICIIICLGIYIEKAKLFNLHLFEELVFSTLVFLTSPKSQLSLSFRVGAVSADI